MRKFVLIAALVPATWLGAACRDASEPGTTDGGTDATPTGSDTGDSSAHAICDAYLECVAAVAPTGLPAAQMGFGDAGSCWQGSEKDAQLCLDACKTAMEMFIEAFPEQEKCALCKAHSECDMAAGELCHLGKCTVTTCGDGVVQAAEICDGQPGCDGDCLGPAACNPFSHEGCTNQSCLVVLEYGGGSTTVHAECLDNGTLVQVAGCEMFNPAELCQSGLACTAPELLPACHPDGADGCCARICDLEAPKCNNGETCVPYQPPPGYQLVPELGYLGVCVPA